MNKWTILCFLNTEYWFKVTVILKYCLIELCTTHSADQVCPSMARVHFKLDFLQLDSTQDAGKAS